MGGVVAFEICVTGFLIELLDLVSEVENCSGEVNSAWILSKPGRHVPKQFSTDSTTF